MDYKPRYTQPFTLAEASGLDVETITEGGLFRLRVKGHRLILPEIARLQNSLQHLSDTQRMLREHVASVRPPEEVDVEITKAIEENEVVMYAGTRVARSISASQLSPT
jgi:hypothetical protein